MIVRRRAARGPGRRALDVAAELAGRGLARAGLRRMTLYERRLERRSILCGRGLAHGWLDADGMARLATVRGASERELLARLEGGARCFGTTEAGRIVACRWVATGGVEVPFLRATVRLADGDAWVWDSWTDPCRRGSGLARAASAAMGDALEREGIRRLVAAVMLGNRPGRAAVLGSGYRQLGTVTSVRTRGSRRVGFRARRQAYS